jgi:hypothetical protein
MQSQLAGQVNPVRLQHASSSSQVKIVAILLDSVCIPMEESWSMARLDMHQYRVYTYTMH